MNAQQAKEKSLWNRLNKSIKERIEYAVKNGRNQIYCFELNNKELFDSIDTNMDILIKLGYKVKLFTYTSVFNNGNEREMIIYWD